MRALPEVEVWGMLQEVEVWGRCKMLRCGDAVRC